MGDLYRLDFPSGKSYIGITTKGASHRYNGHRMSAESGSKFPVHCAWRKHGPPRLIVLATMDDRDLPAAEIEAIRSCGTLFPSGYNLSYGGDVSPMANPAIAAKLIGNKHSLGVFPSEETRRKLSASRTGRRLSDATRKKVSDARMGMRFSDETRARISVAKTGLKASAATRLKMSAANLGRTPSEETRQKISAALSGRTLSDEHRRKLSEANKGKGVGRTFSDETRKKLSEAARLREQAKRDQRAPSRGDT